MNKKEITFRDPVVERVVDKFVNDVMEELMDAVLYIQTAREEIADNEKV